jgi:gliding motility-associated-like protein
MKPISLLTTMLLIVGLSSGVKAQNLVPNGNFESYNNCPSALSGIAYSPAYTNFPTALYWVNPLQPTTPDYLNMCAPGSSGVKVPLPIFGYQNPHSGNGYAGIIAWDGQIVNGNMVFDYREYMQNQLSQPLIAGHNYCVSFYVSPTISSGFSFNYVALDGVGVNLSGNQTTINSGYTLQLSYDVQNQAGKYLTDTALWYKVKATYTAQGGEKWITIGSFKTTSAPPSFVQVYPPTTDPNLSYRCYLYIDDVSITEITAADTIRSVHDTSVCSLTGISNLLSGATGAVSYQWQNGSTSGQLTATDTGTFWCRSFMECGLMVDTFHIRYTPSYNLNLGKDTVNCQSQPVTISANNSYSSYLWSTGASSSSIIVAQSGAYVLTVSGDCGLQKDTINVTIQQPTDPPLVYDTTLCQLDPSPVLHVDGTNIKWYSSIGGLFGVPVQPFISTAQHGQQILYVTQTIGKCESPKVPLNIDIRYKPDPEIGDYFHICQNTDTVIIGHEYPGVSYLWNTNEFVCCIIPRYTGAYRLTITNECGTASDTAFVEMSSCDDCLSMPNAFTPNSDGRNDYFMPMSQCPVTDYKMAIFNRWGQMVFSTTDLYQGWNGGFKGVMADGGTYVYMVSFRSVTTGSLKTLRGNVTLLR